MGCGSRWFIVCGWPSKEVPKETLDGDGPWMDIDVYALIEVNGNTVGGSSSYLDV